MAIARRFRRRRRERAIYTEGKLQNLSARHRVPTNQSFISTERPTEFHHHNRPLAPRGPPPRPNGSDYPGHGGRTAAAVPSNAPNVRMRRADGTGVDVYYCDFCLVKVFRGE